MAQKVDYFPSVEIGVKTTAADAARLAPEAVSPFLDELSRHQEPWQVQQAREAIRRRDQMGCLL